MVTRQMIVRWLRLLGGTLAENRDVLTDLDAAIGDADHGVNMDRGFTAVLRELDHEASGPSSATIAATLQRTGMALVKSVGGASGPLYGTLFLRAAAAAGTKEALDGPALSAMFRAGLDGVLQRGKAQAGDKTMVDALLPAVEAMERACTAGWPLEAMMKEASRAAEEGMKSTTPLRARKGRASYLGERSIGHQDPGATSAWLLVRTAAEAWSPESRDDATASS
jgi:phosphoenolpyruvate---glycerone phosphotransferase subunit DhaL